FAASVLCAEAFSACLHLGGYIFQPRLAVIAALAVTRPAFVVVQILAVCIPLGRAVQALGLVHVPAHEIQGIAKVFTAGEPASGFTLIVIPGFVLGLCIAVG